MAVAVDTLAGIVSQPVEAGFRSLPTYRTPSVLPHMRYTPGPDGSARKKSSPDRSTSGLGGGKSQSCPEVMRQFQQSGVCCAKFFAIAQNPSRLMMLSNLHG
jgi:hypothetical protein